MRKRPGIRQSIEWAAAAALWFCIAGCGGLSVQSDTTHRVLSLSESELQAGGIALLTPSTVTGREQDRQALAQAFFEVISERRPDLQVTSLAGTLSAVNRAGRDETYERMFVEARDTGLFRRASLREVAEATGARFFAQLKLASFRQESLLRWSFLGLRLMETKRARLRVFLELWDSGDGSIVWEGAVEMIQALDTSSEYEVTLRMIAQRAATELVTGLPGTPAEASGPTDFTEDRDQRPMR